MPASTSPRRVVIIGCYDSKLPPSIREGWEIWTLNDCYRHLWDDDLEPDRIYELHDPAHRPWRKRRHWRYLRQTEAQVWTFTHKPPLPETSNLYPLTEILESYPAYFSNSIAWMLAHALYEKVDEVWLLRLRFATPHERVQERAGVEFWCGYLQASGVNVRVEAGSGLLSTPYGLYGLSDTGDANARFYDAEFSEFPSDYRDALRDPPVEEEDAPPIGRD